MDAPECKNCKGVGWKADPRDGSGQNDVACPDCGGSGREETGQTAMKDTTGWGQEPGYLNEIKECPGCKNDVGYSPCGFCGAEVPND